MGKEQIAKGWIAGLKDAEEDLKACGVELGEWIPDEEGSSYGSWENCKVSGTAMKLLNSLWGRVVWHLEI